MGCQFHILDGDVIGEIQPSTALGRHGPKGLKPVRCVFGLRQVGGLGAAAHGVKGHHGGIGPLAQRCMGREGPIGRARGVKAGDHASLRHEGCDILAPSGAGILVAGDVDQGVPAARHQQAVGVDLEIAPRVRARYLG